MALNQSEAAAPQPRAMPYSQSPAGDTIQTADTSKSDDVVLLIGADLPSRRRIGEWLPAGYRLVTARTTEEAEGHFAHLDIAIMICEEQLGEQESGLVLLAGLHTRHPLTQPVLLSNALDESLFEFALNEAGVAGYLRKPLQEDALLKVIGTAGALYRDAVGLQALRERSRQRTRGLRGILYWPRALQRNMRMLARYARNVTLTSSAIIVGMQLLFLAVGALIFFALYLFKSMLGINLLQDLHLQDLLSG